MTSERIASSVARPPALRMMWASPVLSPRTSSTGSGASMQVRIARCRAGESRQRGAIELRDVGAFSARTRSYSRRWVLTWDIGISPAGADPTSAISRRS